MKISPILICALLIILIIISYITITLVKTPQHQGLCAMSTDAQQLSQWALEMDYAQTYSISGKDLLKRKLKETQLQAIKALATQQSPYDRVQIYGALGIAQYWMNDLPQARQSLDKMLQIQHDCPNEDSNVYDTALKYIADIAWREGLNEQGKEFDIKVIESEGLGMYWRFAPDKTTIVSNQYNLIIPIRIGHFHLEFGSGTTIYYSNLLTGQTISLHTDEQETAAQSTSEIEAKLQNDVSRMFAFKNISKNNVSEITLASGSFAKTGTKWIFDIRDDEITDKIYIITIPQDKYLFVLYNSPREEAPEDLQYFKEFIEHFVWKPAHSK